MCNNKPLISVIVPIYNGEKWLLPTLRSISAQTFMDFEILLIDDGSVDNSAKICKSFLEKERVKKIIHINTGRNTATLVEAVALDYKGKRLEIGGKF